MMSYSNKWIDKIVELQHEDGSWGCFHSLAKPTDKTNITTEQALRRLYILGLTSEDEPIQKALKYMRNVLNKETIPHDGREQVLNWDAFEKMMMATWIRRFLPNDEQAIEIAKFWAGIISLSFSEGNFKEELYEKEYRKKIPKLHAKEKLIGVCQFYMVNLLHGVLDDEIESQFVDYIISNPTGIYYVNDNCILNTPKTFASLQTSRYIGALECLSGYDCASEKLSFAKTWLLENKDENGWDLGTSVKDGVYFPISDSWRKAEYRINDCTMRIQKLLDKLE